MNNKLEAARTQMVRQQVRAWDVLDPAVLDVLARVPREDFVPAAFRSLAFADTAVPLGHGQSMLTPQLEGRMLQSLALQSTDRVLEVGTGSGFFTACLAALAGEVQSLEIRPELAGQARRTLSAHGVRNAEVVTEDVFRYAPPAAGFDAIAVTGSIPAYDHRFQEWLAEGGRLFLVVGEPPLMEALLVRRGPGGVVSRTSLFETEIPPLLNAAGGERFRF